MPGYVFHAFPVPNSLSTWGLGVLDLIFGWELSAKALAHRAHRLRYLCDRQLANEIGGDNRWVYLVGSDAGAAEYVVLDRVCELPDRTGCYLVVGRCGTSQ